MSDIDDAMDEASRKARSKFGVSGSKDDSNSSDEEDVSEDEEESNDETVSEDGDVFDAINSTDEEDIIESAQPNRPDQNTRANQGTAETNQDSQPSNDRAEFPSTSAPSATSESLEVSQASATSNTSKTPETTESSTTEDTETGVDSGSSSVSSNSETGQEDSRGRVVDEFKNVNMYLPEELREDLNNLFKQMDLEASIENGTELQKNRDFYPAIIRTAMRNKSDLREELGIEQ